MKKQLYTIERKIFDAWWAVATASNPGDAHLVAKSLNEFTKSTTRVVIITTTHTSVLAQYEKKATSTIDRCPNCKELTTRLNDHACAVG